jgi:hypothetical protein
MRQVDRLSWRVLYWETVEVFVFVVSFDARKDLSERVLVSFSVPVPRADRPGTLVGVC